MEVQSIRVDENKTFVTNFLVPPEFDLLEKKIWMEKNWTYSLYGVALYVSFIYWGQEWMKNRKPMQLKSIMAVWNAILAVFSIAACMTVVPEFVGYLMSPTGGFHRSICGNVMDVSKPAMFWGWAFTMSKLAELGDTVFIVLRKRPLIFLHWYHHITVLLYSWYSFSDMIAPSRWFVVVNFSIHALMYSYYWLRAVGFKIPKPIAMTITILQLSQMIVGVVVNGYAYQQKTNNVECEVSNHHVQMGLAMYASYFILFGHFFYKAYFDKNSKKWANKKTD